MGQGAAWVELDGILEALNGQTHGTREPLMPVVTSLEVQLIRLRVFRRSFDAPDQAHFEPLCDRPGDLILDVEEVIHPTVVTLRPQVESVADLNESHGNA